MALAAEIRQAAAKVHQPAALAIDWHTRAGRGPKLSMHWLILCQLRRVQLREPTTQVHAPGASRQRLVRQRTERHKIGAPGGEQVKTVFVIEAECPISGYGNGCLD